MKKYSLIISCLLILQAFLLFNLCNRNRKSSIETFNVDSTTKEEIADELVIALFIEDITKEVEGEVTLEEYTAMRKRLTSDVTHELRTPVANLSSYMEMMSDGIMEPMPERLQNCYAELQRLSGLISDLERLRQEENENLVLDKSDVDLRKLSQAVMGTLRFSFGKSIWMGR